MQLRKIAKSYGATNTSYSNMDYDRCAFNDIVDLKVHVLRFAYKTNKSMVFKKYEKNGKTIKVAKRNEEYSSKESVTANKKIETT